MSITFSFDVCVPIIVIKTINSMETSVPSRTTVWIEDVRLTFWIHVAFYFTITFTLTFFYPATVPRVIMSQFGVCTRMIKLIYITWNTVFIFSFFIIRAL